MILILIYIFSISSANISVSYFGPESSIINSFLFIGLDLSLRDKLHEVFSKQNLFLKMSLLIIFSGFISYVVNPASGLIALASVISFILSSSVDSFFYNLFSLKTYIKKSNISNFFSSAVDSIIFPLIAFGSFLPIIVIYQFSAKILGGFIFSLLISKILHK